MKSYCFQLTFKLPNTDEDGTIYLDSLYEAGCSDALVGVGLKRSIGIDFTREATSLSEAVLSAINDVQKAIPNCLLTKVDGLE